MYLLLSIMVCISRRTISLLNVYTFLRISFQKTLPNITDFDTSLKQKCLLLGFNISKKRVRNKVIRDFILTTWYNHMPFGQSYLRCSHQERRPCCQVFALPISLLALLSFWPLLLSLQVAWPLFWSTIHIKINNAQDLIFFLSVVCVIWLIKY